jgi:predicted CXXCH cytochrome family protein
MKKLFALLLIFSTITVLVSSCNRSNKHSSVYDVINEKSVDSTLHSTWNSLQHDRLIKVTEENFPEFYIYERKSRLTNFKCSGCHEEDLDELKAKAKGNALAHVDIKYYHTPLDVMTCVTCHTSDNMDVLHSSANKSIDFNRSYKLCSQCHQKEFKDWKGGAHGKRVGGWVAPRVSKTCVECHNPHDPSFKTKIPTYPAYLQQKRN